MIMLRIGVAWCVVAVALALSALASAPAWATGGPVLENSKGETLSGSVSFTSKSAGKPALQATEGEKVTCKEGTGTGSLEDVDEEESAQAAGSTEMKFTGCETLGIKCHSTGREAGVIALEASIALVWLNKEENKPGVLFSIEPLSSSPGNGAGGKLVLECATVKVEIEGAFLAPIAPFETATKTLTTTAKQSKGKQEQASYFECGAEGSTTLWSSTSGGKFVKAGAEDESAHTTSEEVKIVK